MNKNNHCSIEESLRLIPQSPFLLSSQYDGFRSGVLTEAVQIVNFNPPTIIAALPTGCPVEPHIRDSRFFGLSYLSEKNHITKRRFRNMPNREDDPFLGILLNPQEQRVPLIESSPMQLICEQSGHIAVDGNKRIYVATVIWSKTEKENIQRELHSSLKLSCAI